MANILCDFDTTTTTTTTTILWLSGFCLIVLSFDDYQKLLLYVFLD